MRSWKLGTAFGIGVFIHWSFLLLPIWVFLTNLSRGPVTAALYLVLLTLGVFGCIVLHELGHALMARHFGIATRDITLYPIGGIARLERMSERPWEEFSIALAGPVVNIAIAGILGVLLSVLHLPGALGDAFEQSGIVMFAMHLLGANVFLACFNLLPAFPMDGGRILRALLAVRLGHLRATEIAAGLGLGMSVLFFALAVIWGEFGLMLLALFVFLLGRQELAFVRYRDWQRSAQAKEQTNGRFHFPQADDAEFSGFTWDPRSRLWLQWRNGQVVQAVAMESDYHP